MRRAARSSARWQAIQVTRSRSGSSPIWRRPFLVGAAAALLSFACTPRTLTNPVTQSLQFAPWQPTNARRGMGLSPKTPLSLADYGALDLLRPGAVVLYSTQLG